MISGGSNPNVSLLPDNPGVRIEAIVGGGHSISESKWSSKPVKIESDREFNLTTNLGSLKKYQTRWRQTLGPSVPSRRKPRQDPHIIIGTLNVSECPTYIAAPLRGDIEAANLVFSWADDLLQDSPESHVVFLTPLISKQKNSFKFRDVVSSLVFGAGFPSTLSEGEFD